MKKQFDLKPETIKELEKIKKKLETDLRRKVSLEETIDFLIKFYNY